MYSYISRYSFLNISIIMANLIVEKLKKIIIIIFYLKNTLTNDVFIYLFYFKVIKYDNKVLFGLYMCLFILNKI